MDDGLLLAICLQLEGFEPYRQRFLQKLVLAMTKWVFTT